MVNINSLLELRSQLNKNLYCFGVGKLFESFMEEFSTLNFEYDIKATVDNDPDRFEYPVKTVNHISIPIISFTQMLNDIEDCDCILITTWRYEEIIDQINGAEKLRGIPYYIYPVLRINQYDNDRLKVKIPSKMSMYEEIQIPKVIHYCWFGRKEIPARYRKWMESWKYYCPDYEIVEWNEDNYDVHKSRYVHQAYELQKWAFVSDYARIDIVSQYGGVYLDTDVELVRNIDEMLRNDAFCGFESNQFVAYGLGFGAKKDNALIGEIKEYYDTTDFVLEDGTLNQINCPVVQTEVMKRHGLVCNGEFQIVDGMAVYPERVLCGMSSHSFRVERNPLHTYAIHHYDASWLEDRQSKLALISMMKKWSKNADYIYLD